MIKIFALLFSAVAIAASGEHASSNSFLNADVLDVASDNVGFDTRGTTRNLAMLSVGNIISSRVDLISLNAALHATGQNLMLNGAAVFTVFAPTDKVRLFPLVSKSFS
jgi:uncharacterized surface protein with fasciclin (FAS1) repeats